MKMFVVYDERGDIISVDLPSEIKGESIMLTPGNWLLAAEVEIDLVSYVSQIEVDLDDISNLAMSIVNNFRIRQGN